MTMSRREAERSSCGSEYCLSQE